MSIDKFGRAAHTRVVHGVKPYEGGQAFDKRLSDIQKLLIDGRLNYTDQIAKSRNELEKEIAHLKTTVDTKIEFSEIEKVKDILNFRIDEEVKSLIGKVYFDKQFEEQKKTIANLKSIVDTKIEFSEVEQVRDILNFRIDNEVKSLGEKFKTIVDTVLLSKRFLRYITYRLDLQSFDLVERYVRASYHFAWDEYKSHNLSDKHVGDLFLSKMNLTEPREFWEVEKEREEE